MPGIRHLGPDVLQLGIEVRGHDGLGRQEAEEAGGQKPAAEVDDCRSQSEARNPEGYRRKKALGPAERRELIDHAREAYGLSERGAAR